MPGFTLILTTAVLLTSASAVSVDNKIIDNKKALEVKQAFKTNSIETSSKNFQLEDLKNGTNLIAQKYGGDPHGPDPHGDDPHDETYDSKMPANKKRNFNRAPKDVYGDKYPNSQAPY